MSEELRYGVHERAVNSQYITLGCRTKVRFRSADGAGSWPLLLENSSTGGVIQQ